MKRLILIFTAAVLTMLLGGCQTPEEQDQHTAQRNHDIIVKQGQDTIKRNQYKMMFQNQ
jgi:hypothetical protein